MGINRGFQQAIYKDKRIFLPGWTNYSHPLVMTVDVFNDLAESVAIEKAY